MAEAYTDHEMELVVTLLDSGRYAEWAKQAKLARGYSWNGEELFWARKYLMDELLWLATAINGKRRTDRGLTGPSIPGGTFTSQENPS